MHHDMQQLYRLAQFGRLAAGIVHDLMNPLTAISLAIEKLTEENLDKTKDVAEHINRAIRAAERIASLMHITRKQLKYSGGSCQFCPITETNEAIALVSYKARSMSVAIRTDFNKSEKIFGDPIMFFQAMVNLMANAIDAYTTIPLPYRPRRPIEIGIREYSHTVEIRIKDCGCGISKGTRKSLFQGCFTTKGDHGIGLGLSHTKDILEKEFKGTLSFESKVGKGSTFIVRIPLIEPGKFISRQKTNDHYN
jgi:signal transduction histidine kinase